MRSRASQVARIRLVETEEDVETYRPALDASKATIGDRQAELARLEGLSADATEARRRLEEDFASIMEGVLLPEDTCIRLLQECVSRIVVHSDYIDIETRTGVTVPIPRIEGNHRSRWLMWWKECFRFQISDGIV